MNISTSFLSFYRFFSMPFISTKEIELIFLTKRIVIIFSSHLFSRSPKFFSVAEHQSVLIAEQLLRKERLEKELKAEKGRLEAMKRELQLLTKPVDSTGSPVQVR